MEASMKGGGEADTSIFGYKEVQRNGIPAHCQWASILEAMAVAGRMGVVRGNEWGNLLGHFQLCDLGHTM